MFSFKAIEWIKRRSFPWLSLDEHAQLCQDYLNLLYHSSKPAPQQDFAKTYGEITYISLNALLLETRLSPTDVFLDLGSGLGKAVTQVFLTTPVKEACGIEMIPALHQKAEFVKKIMQSELPFYFEKERKLTFLCGDFLTMPFHHATVILMVSTCFPAVLLHTMSQLIDSMPYVHTILSLRPLPLLKNFIFSKAIRLECSWDTALCYVYRKSN